MPGLERGWKEKMAGLESLTPKKSIKRACILAFEFERGATQLILGVIVDLRVRLWAAISAQGGIQVEVFEYRFHGQGELVDNYSNDV